ncbi:MAG: acyloxyacyl hydrolase [Desulforhopalus sp.]
MKNAKILFISLGVLFISSSLSFAEMSAQLGIGYGQEFKENEDVEQYEIFWRQPLPYSTTLGDTWDVTTDIEFAAAFLRESGGDSETGRFSIMPQVILSPHDMFNFIVGFGAGFMEGDTEFSDQNLGGSFLFASKVGLQLLLGGHWGLEYTYYHQSNAGLYDENDGLNMHHLAIAYNF